MIVLLLCRDRLPFLQSRRYRDVRAAVARLGRTMQQKMYDGKSPEEYIRWSVKAQIARDAERRLKQRDADKVEKTQLRAARLQRLAALQEEQGQGSLLALSAVPDGAVETGAPAVSAATLAAGVGAQSSFAVKAGRRTLATGRGSTGGSGARGFTRIRSSETLKDVSSRTRTLAMMICHHTCRGLSIARGCYSPERVSAS